MYMIGVFIMLFVSFYGSFFIDRNKIIARIALTNGIITTVTPLLFGFEFIIKIDYIRNIFTLSMLVFYLFSLYWTITYLFFNKKINKKAT